MDLTWIDTYAMDVLLYGLLAALVFTVLAVWQQMKAERDANYFFDDDERAFNLGSFLMKAGGRFDELDVHIQENENVRLYKVINMGLMKTTASSPERMPFMKVVGQ